MAADHHPLCYQLAAERPKPEFKFKDDRASSRVVVDTEDLVIGYDRPLSKTIKLHIEYGDKVVIKGANGIGKTTLLKSILGLIPAISGKVGLGDYTSPGYFEQELSGDGEDTCIDEIWNEFPSYTQYEVRSALAKCGLTTKHIESKIKVLSGGEQAKVRLCKLMQKPSNVLILDEPTNHLDVDAKASLKEAIKAYKGTVIMVCHEPEFYEELGVRVVDFSEFSLLA